MVNVLTIDFDWIDQSIKYMENLVDNCRPEYQLNSDNLHWMYGSTSKRFENYFLSDKHIDKVLKTN